VPTTTGTPTATSPRRLDVTDEDTGDHPDVSARSGVILVDALLLGGVDFALAGHQEVGEVADQNVAVDALCVLRLLALQQQGQSDSLALPGSRTVPESGSIPT